MTRPLNARDFELDAGIALHQGDVAERVRGGLGEIRVMPLDRALHGEGAVHHRHRECDKANAQRDQWQSEPPVERERSRQQERDEDKRGEMLAKERHPQPPQGVGAGQHHFDLPPGMGAGMVGERELQHVLEIISGEDQVAAMVRKPVCEPGDQRAGDNDEQAEADPGANERRQNTRGRSEPGRQRARERIDDAAQQHWLDELRAGKRDIGEGEGDRELGVGAKECQHAQIDADESHAGILGGATKKQRVAPDQIENALRN